MRTSTATLRAARAGAPRRPRRRSHAFLLQRCRGPEGALRELLALPAAEGSVLVVDRNPLTGEDRLIAHLGVEEPFSNAKLAADIYAAADPNARRCRVVEAEDACRAPAIDEPLADGFQATTPAPGGEEFRLARVPGEMSIPSLRWTRCAVTGATPATVSLRDAIAAHESYEPFRALTRAAVADHEQDPAVSITVLRAELTRVLDSPIVLNRALREAVAARVAGGSMTMSAIASRCGRLKRDARGCVTGETSWLARRIGLLPEGGQREPTRWVHSEVLALIAREGLGIAPREVELG